MTVIPGVELTCSVDTGEVHLLGYFVHLDHAALQATLATYRAGRNARGQMIVDKLNALGIPVRWDEIVAHAGGESVGRPHVARALIALGIVQNVDEAFDRFLGRGRPAFAERPRLLPADAVRVVRAAGGVPVLAHPLSVSDLEATLTEMIPAGLLGIEAYYGAYTPKEQAALAALAAQHHLIVTVGNDFHGDVHGGALLGGTIGPSDVLDRLVAAAATVQSPMVGTG